MRPATPAVESKRFICRLPENGRLVQERFPVVRHPSCRAGNGLISRMRMRGKQLRTVDHRLLFVIVEPVLARLEAGNNWMSGGRCMLGGMLAGRTVAATDVPALRAPAEVKPPAS